MALPSILFSSSLHALSGCGIMPNTFLSVIADTGYIIDSAVRVGVDMHFAILIAIAEYHLVILIQLFHSGSIGIIPAFAMRYRYLQYLFAYIAANKVLCYSRS